MAQYGVMSTPLSERTLPYTVHVGAPFATSTSFGVGRGFAVLVGVFALMLALMILGGHLRASLRRKRSKRRENRR